MEILIYVLCGISAVTSIATLTLTIWEYKEKSRIPSRALLLAERALEIAKENREIIKIQKNEKEKASEDRATY